MSVSIEFPSHPSGCGKLAAVHARVPETRLIGRHEAKTNFTTRTGAKGKDMTTIA